MMKKSVRGELAIFDFQIYTHFVNVCQNEACIGNVRLFDVRKNLHEKRKEINTHKNIIMECTKIPVRLVFDECRIEQQLQTNGKKIGEMTTRAGKLKYESVNSQSKRRSQTHRVCVYFTPFCQIRITIANIQSADTHRGINGFRVYMASNECKMSIYKQIEFSVCEL